MTRKESRESWENASQYRDLRKKKYYFPYENERDLLTLRTTDMPTHSLRRGRGELRGRKQHAESVFLFFIFSFLSEEAAGM